MTIAMLVRQKYLCGCEICQSYEDWDEQGISNITTLETFMNAIDMRVTSENMTVKDNKKLAMLI